MSDASRDTLDLIPLPQLQRRWGYEDPRPVKQILDALGVPFVVLRRLRHYRAADLRDGLNRATVIPCRAAAAEQTPELHETGPPKPPQ